MSLTPTPCYANKGKSFHGFLYIFFSLNLQNKQCIFAEVTPFPQHTTYVAFRPLQSESYSILEVINSARNPLPIYPVPVSLPRFALSWKIKAIINKINTNKIKYINKTHWKYLLTLI